MSVSATITCVDPVITPQPAGALMPNGPFKIPLGVVVVARVVGRVGDRHRLRQRCRTRRPGWLRGLPRGSGTTDAGACTSYKPGIPVACTVAPAEAISPANEPSAPPVPGWSTQIQRLLLGRQGDRSHDRRRRGR